MTLMYGPYVTGGAYLMSNYFDQLFRLLVAVDNVLNEKVTYMAPLAAEPIWQGPASRPPTFCVQWASTVACPATFCMPPN